MDMDQITKIAIALGIVYLGYKYLPGQAMKAAALGVGGVIVAKQVPYVKEAI